MFKNVPLDEGVKIVKQQEDKIGNYNVLFQFWVMEGVSAVSAIFLSSEVADISDSELQNLVKKECNTEETTISRGEDYTFVNYGFNVF